MFAAALVLFLASGPAPAGAADLPLPTVRFDTARFRVVASARAEAPARALAPTLEALRDEVSASLGRDWPGRTEVRVGLGREEYEALAVPGSRPPGWAVALAWPALNVVLVDARTIASPEGLTTLRHELVHVALGRLGADWPRWFQEGVAQMVTNERQFRTEHYSTMAIALATDRLYDFEALRDGFPERPQDVEVAYAQSAEFVSFLYKSHGPVAFGMLVDEVGRGAVFEQAFARAFRSSLTVEEGRFRDDAALRYPWWPVVLGSGTALWALSGVLMAFAAVRRRRQVHALREHQRYLEQLEDTAVVLLGALPYAANEDGGGAVDPLPALPWRITAVRSAG